MAIQHFQLQQHLKVNVWLLFNTQIAPRTFLTRQLAAYLVATQYLSSQTTQQHHETNINSHRRLKLGWRPLPKSRGIHIILGLLFRLLGFHNFYSGHNLRGGIKISILMLSILLDATTGFYSAFSLVVAVIFSFWALIEIIAATKDASGNTMT